MGSEILKRKYLAYIIAATVSLSKHTSVINAIYTAAHSVPLKIIPITFQIHLNQIAKKWHALITMKENTSYIIYPSYLFKIILL